MRVCVCDILQSLTTTDCCWWMIVQNMFDYTLLLLLLLLYLFITINLCIYVCIRVDLMSTRILCRQQWKHNKTKKKKLNIYIKIIYIQSLMLSSWSKKKKFFFSFIISLFFQNFAINWKKREGKKKETINTLSGGSLGSWIDEERS